MVALMELRAGTRWHSAVSDAEVIVVKPPSGPVDLRCGGVPMVPSAGAAPAPAPLPGETLRGKRYEHEPSGLLLLCTKGGQGELSLGDEVLGVQVARALPASD